jgi:hypothetical protein
MSGTKWTPGPWRFGNGNFSNIIEGPTGKEKIDEWDDGYAVVASVQACCSSRLDVDRQSNGIANMHLIAAAPALYEALEYALLLLEQYEESATGESFNSPMINAALAAARGETP